MIQSSSILKLVTEATASSARFRALLRTISFYDRAESGVKSAPEDSPNQQPHLIVLIETAKNISCLVLLHLEAGLI